MPMSKHRPIDEYETAPDGQLVLTGTRCIQCGVPWSDCPVRIGAERAAAATKGTS